MRYHCCTCSRCRRYTCWLTRMSIPLSLLLDKSWSTKVSGMRYQIRVRLSEERHRRLDEPSGLLGTFAFRLRFYSCIAEVYGGPRALVLRASTSCAGPPVVGSIRCDKTQSSFPEEASTQGFRSSPACKASGLSLYRNLRRPYSFLSEERVGSPPP